MNKHDETTVWLGAARYYMGRMTYAVSDFCELLCLEWRNLSEDTRYLIQRDLETEFERDDELRAKGFKQSTLPLGHDCDREQWEKVRRLYR